MDRCTCRLEPMFSPAESFTGPPPTYESDEWTVVDAESEELCTTTKQFAHLIAAALNEYTDKYCQACVAHHGVPKPYPNSVG